MAKQTPFQTGRARHQRRSLSKSQRRLWYELRDRRIGYKFQREKPIGPYIMDFYCVQVRLCVEVDGEQHDACQARDEARDKALSENKITTLRVTSRDCFRTPHAIALLIKQKCDELAAG